LLKSTRRGKTASRYPKKVVKVKQLPISTRFTAAIKALKRIPLTQNEALVVQKVEGKIHLPHKANGSLMIL